MDPRDTWRALQQNDQLTAVRRAKKRNKQVHMITSRLNKSLLKMQVSAFVNPREWRERETHTQTRGRIVCDCFLTFFFIFSWPLQTSLVAFRWNLQRSVPLRGELSKISWSNVSYFYRLIVTVDNLILSLSFMSIVFVCLKNLDERCKFI